LQIASKVFSLESILPYPPAVYTGVFTRRSFLRGGKPRSALPSRTWDFRDSALRPGICNFVFNCGDVEISAQD
jgi:hypothetical protein